MKLAIIGASTGQLPLALKAKEMGIETYCFAWNKGAVCKESVDHFYPISVTDKQAILEICKKEKVDGVASNASELSASIVAYIEESLGIEGNKEIDIINIQNKLYVRNHTKDIEGLSDVESVHYMRGMSMPYSSCIIKPIYGSSKKGVFFVDSQIGFENAVISNHNNGSIIIEKFIDGREISVESVSVRGEHYVVQLTDKENSGPPHFVELSHHQPSSLMPEIQRRVKKLVPSILDRLGFKSGASHIEMKINEKNEIFLIEVNPRGGGDEISNSLVKLSTGVDYVSCIIKAALGMLTPDDIKVTKRDYAGIYFLCAQAKGRLEFLKTANKKSWYVNGTLNDSELIDATGNYDRNGYVIYKSDHRVNP